MTINSNKNKYKLTRAKVEIHFIGATRNDPTGGLRSAIQRCELMEMIVRMAQGYIINKYGGNARISKHL